MNLILVYHRIANDGWQYSVSPAHFAQQLELLARETDVVRLPDLVRDRDRPLRHGRPRVAITFDDGYVDNVTHGWPLLQARGLPATFFVISSKVGSTRELWWDELEWLLQRAAARRCRVALELDGMPHVWDFADSARFSEQPCEFQLGRVGAAAFQMLHGTLLAMPSIDAQEQLLDELAGAIDVQTAARPDRLIVSCPQLLQLAADDRAEIGAHTRSHLRLSNCSPDIQVAEIHCSKRQLEAIVHRAVTSFSYPYGELAPDTAAIVREAGFACACTVASRPVGQQDAYRLPRLMPRDWDTEAVAAQFDLLKRRTRPASR
jgi:peptidoglycan/xylan/chitin deacetylase (PgdA/CDA1 family)